MQWKGLSISPCNLCPRECLAHRAEGQRACAAGGLQWRPDIRRLLTIRRWQRGAWRDGRHSGEPVFDENGMMQRGVIVRHLLLPGHKKNARDVIRYVFETYGDAVYLSLLNQYTPFERLREMPEYQSICRKVTRREYDAVVDYALERGVRNAFVQEGDTARESFIPAFDGEGMDF